MVSHAVCGRRKTLAIPAPPGAAEYRRGLSEAATVVERNPRDALTPENQPRQGRQKQWRHWGQPRFYGNGTTGTDRTDRACKSFVPSVPAVPVVPVGV